MKKNIITSGLMLLFSLSLLYSDTIIVDISGSGNYLTIQEGIDNSVSGDTILVYPGIYYENINYNGKNITVASLYLTTQADSFIHQTIIDGNRNGSVVTFSNGEDSTAVLYGLTLLNGTGTIDLYNRICGGGILCKNSQPMILNSNIKNNTADYGGGIYCRTANIVCKNNIIENNLGSGIYCWQSNVSLINNVIRFNHSYYGGGGLCCTLYSSAYFDSIERNDIYLNYAGHSSDVYATSDCSISSIILDTATVNNNVKDFIYFNDGQQPLIDILHSKIMPINHDLYISPNGNDANSGLTQSDPLKTISWALIKVTSDSTHPNTIYLDSGVYSPELTGEKFPLNMRSYVSLVGESKKETVLNANEESIVIGFSFKDINIDLKNLTIENAFSNNSGAIDIHDSNPIIRNVLIKNNVSDGMAGGIFGAHNSFPIFENVDVLNNTAETGGGGWFGVSSNPVFINCSISNNTGLNSYGGTGGLDLGETALLANSTICNNVGQLYGSAYLSGNEKKFINVTVNGHSNSQGAIHVYNNQILKIINSILWNDGNEVYYGSGGQSYVEVSYTDIRNGESGIQTNGNGTYNWGDGNISEDPLFVGGDPYSYELSKNSPCIDAGTPDTTGLHLPATDLAGNQRIYNGRIDIGAYEYQGIGIDEPDTSFIHNLYLFKNTPNPFKESTTISFISADYERIKEYRLSIYNTKGQLVRRYEGSKDDFWVRTEIVWDGTDEQGRQVAPGTYLYKLEYNGHAVVRKMVLLR